MRTSGTARTEGPSDVATDSSWRGLLLVAVAVALAVGCSSIRQGSQSDTAAVSATDSLAVVTLADSFVSYLRRGDTLNLHRYLASAAQLQSFLQVFEFRSRVVDNWGNAHVIGLGWMNDGLELAATFDVPVRSLPSHCYPEGVNDQITFGYRRRGPDWRISFISSPVC